MKLCYSFLLLVMIHTTYPMKRPMDLQDMVHHTMDLEYIVNPTPNTAPFNAQKIRDNLPRAFVRYAMQTRINNQSQPHRVVIDLTQETSPVSPLVRALRPLVPQPKQLQRPSKYFYHNETEKLTRQFDAKARELHNRQSVLGALVLHRLTDMSEHLCPYASCKQFFMHTTMLQRHISKKHPGLLQANTQSNQIDEHAQT